MKKILFLTIAALFANTATAALSVYKQTLKVTRTGAGMVEKTISSGWTVVDLSPENSTFAIIRTDKKRKRFTIEQPGNFDMMNVSAARGQKQLILSILVGEELGGMKAKGANKNVYLSPGNGWSIPTRLSISGNDLFNFGGAEWFFDEYSGVLTLDKKNSTDFNIRGVGMGAALAEIREVLTGQGYTEGF